MYPVVPLRIDATKIDFSLRNRAQVERVERKWRRALAVRELSCIVNDTKRLPLFRKIAIDRRATLDGFLTIRGAI